MSTVGDIMMDAPCDVWLRIDDGDELAEAEANTYPVRGGGFAVGWCLSGVGLVKWQFFDTYPEACAWLQSEGFGDFTCE